MAKATEFEFNSTSDGEVIIVHNDCLMTSPIMTDMKDAIEFCRGHRCEDFDMTESSDWLKLNG